MFVEAPEELRDQAGEFNVCGVYRGRHLTEKRTIRASFVPRNGIGTIENFRLPKGSCEVAARVYLLRYGLAGVYCIGNCSGDCIRFRLEFFSSAPPSFSTSRFLRLLGSRVHRPEAIDRASSPQRGTPQDSHKRQLREACARYERGIIFGTNQPCAKLIPLCTSANPRRAGLNPRVRLTGSPTLMYM